MRASIDDENSSVAVTLLPSAQVSPLISSQFPTRTGAISTATADTDAINAPGSGAASPDGGDTPSSMATMTTTNAVLYYPSAQLPTPPPLHRPSSSPALMQQSQHEVPAAVRAVPYCPLSCESDSNEEPLFQRPPPATPIVPSLAYTTSSSPLFFTSMQAPQPDRLCGAVSAKPEGGGHARGGTALYASLLPIPSTPTMATTETPGTLAGKRSAVARETSNYSLAEPTKTHVSASSSNAARIHGGYAGSSNKSTAETTVGNHSRGDRGVQRPLLMTAPNGVAVSSASPAAPVTLTNVGDTVLVAELLPPAKQRRTIHTGVGNRGTLPSGGIGAGPGLSTTAASTGAWALGAATASAAAAAGGASPKPSLRIAAPLRGFGRNPVTSHASGSVSRATTSGAGTAPPPQSFKLYRREGSRKRSADVLSQFSALDLDETPTTPFAETGACNFTSIIPNSNVHNAFPSQPSPPTTVYRGAGGGSNAIGAVSPLIIDYATPVTLSQQIGGSNTFSQVLLHPSQDVLDVSQADTECSNFLARRILTEYNEVRLLGRGSFGTVSLFKEISSGEYVAVKMSPPLRTPEMERRYRRERSVMGMVRGLPHIVQLSAAWEEGRVPRMYMQLEYCPGGSVASVANEKQDRNEPWPEAEVKVFLAHMSIALDALHRTSIAHVDFKPDNILIDRDGAYKLSDFGCSVLLDERGRPRPETRNGYGSPARGQRAGEVGGVTYVNPNSGPVVYTGPGASGLATALNPDSWNDGNELSTTSVDEGDCRYLCADMLNEKQHFKAGDMFSLGMSLFELMSGQPLPRNGDQFLALRRRVPVEMLHRRGYSADLVKLVVALLRSDPTQRPTARQVLQYLRPSSEQLQLLSSSSAMQQWTESAESFCRLQVEEQQQLLGNDGAVTATVDALRCVSALMEASMWLFTTTQQDVHRLAAPANPGKGEEEDEQRCQQPQPPPLPLLQLPRGRRLEMPIPPSQRDEACTPTTLNY
ncbi:serine/threonine-protein kinase, putative [Leishmania panamensis]|uniref:serine/threonine-protein kinase, putative n=1 Tax=Leishmania panamensis TaxID=5679 RepID=UPI0004F71D06|nr:serine/threonine-protein kinase, putative [Leishmania panamensis]AIN97589.1 serine/threonine-protein kinase, putative [Leishmania panamensis]